MDGTEICSLWGREIKEFQAFRGKKKKKKRKKNLTHRVSYRSEHFEAFTSVYIRASDTGGTKRERERERALTRSHLENDGYNLKSSFEKSESENKVQGVLTIKFDSPCTERKREREKNWCDSQRTREIWSWSDMEIKKKVLVKNRTSWLEWNANGNRFVETRLNGESNLRSSR